MDRTQAARIVFAIALSLLIGHELDAVVHQEWRLLPLLALMPDETARLVFIALHVPLFAIIIWLTGHPSPGVARTSQFAIDGFLVVHAGLHFALSDHALYLFEPPLSGLLIYGGGLAGLAHVALIIRRPVLQ